MPVDLQWNVNVEIRTECQKEAGWFQGNLTRTRSDTKVTRLIRYL